MSSGSTMGVTPRFTPRGARELIDDIDLLLDHLGRAMPGRLEACFDDSRGTTARGVGVADPPQVPPAADDDARAGGAGTGAAGAGAATRPTKAAFVGHVAAIARRAAGAQAGSAEDAGAAEKAGTAGLDAAWKGFAGDLAFLIQARDFLGTLAQPATVDTIRLTRAYINETTRRRRWWWGVDRRHGASAAAAASDRSLPWPRNHAVIGAALAGRMARLRLWCFCCVWLTLVISLHVFTGKSLLEDGERTRALLGKVNEDIAAAIAAEVQDARVAAARTARGDSDVAAAAAFAPAYCDQPFLDDDGMVRYASARQETLCNRLWGVNAEVNRLNRHLDAWSAPIVHTPLGVLFGVFGSPASANATGSARDQTAATVGTVRVFPENARRAGFQDALRLASDRARETAGTSAATRPPGAPGVLPGEGGGNAQSSDADAGALDSARAEDRGGRDPAGILSQARRRFEEAGFAGRESLLNGARGIASPSQMQAVIEGGGLYVMPCLYALLGAFVAVFRNIARKGDAQLLDPFDHDRATQAITLGVVFGAVVGLLADMLKAGAAAGQQPAGGATITLGISALALLAGYSAGQVFGLLDDISERVFGRRDAPARPAGA